VACSSSRTRPPIDPPTTCATPVVLSTSAARAEVGPLAVDTQGVDLCVHLVPGNWAFEAYVSTEPGRFELTLEDPGQVILQAGSDQVWAAGPRTYLAWDPPQSMDVTLNVRTTSGTSTVSIDLGLFSTTL